MNKKEKKYARFNEIGNRLTDYYEEHKALITDKVILEPFSFANEYREFAAFREETRIRDEV